MNLIDIENQAGICRVTAGWKKPELPWEWVRRYWRDVHSPAISRRKGIYQYIHLQYDPVDASVFGQIEGISTSAPANAQLMWTSDVRYRDDAALAAFGGDPDEVAKAQLLGDIDLIVERSTTYKCVGDRARTYVDITGNATPQGVPAMPAYSIFLRQKTNEASFFAALRALAERWMKVPGVMRLRLSLCEPPDMEAERKAGYPIKTHPIEQQYQAWIELWATDRSVMQRLLTREDADAIMDAHAYPIIAYHCFVYEDRPTLAGLRGYPAVEALQALGGNPKQKQLEILSWMYGPIVGKGPADGASS